MTAQGAARAAGGADYELVREEAVVEVAQSDDDEEGKSFEEGRLADLAAEVFPASQAAAYHPHCSGHIATAVVEVPGSAFAVAAAELVTPGRKYSHQPAHCAALE